MCVRPLFALRNYSNSALVHNFDIAVLVGCLRVLQMDWKTEPYWWHGSQQQGPTLLRQFPHLEIFTLVMRTLKTTHEDQDMVDMEEAKRYTMRVIESEQARYPEWRVPMIKFYLKKDQIDWSAYSMGGSPAWE